MYTESPALKAQQPLHKYLSWNLILVSLVPSQHPFHADPDLDPGSQYLRKSLCTDFKKVCNKMNRGSDTGLFN